jgi:hypothetical protein
VSLVAYFAAHLRLAVFGSLGVGVKKETIARTSFSVRVNWRIVEQLVDFVRNLDWRIVKTVKIVKKVKIVKNWMVRGTDLEVDLKKEKISFSVWVNWWLVVRLVDFVRNLVVGWKVVKDWMAEGLWVGKVIAAC